MNEARDNFLQRFVEWMRRGLPDRGSPPGLCRLARVAAARADRGGGPGRWLWSSRIFTTTSGFS